MSFRFALRSSFILTLPLIAALSVWGLAGSPFEGADGNFVADTPGNVDWADVANTPALHIGLDLPTGQDDDSLRGKENDPAPDITYGSIPNNKSDLQRFYVVHDKRDVNGVLTDFLHLAWTRANTLGTANIDFEFNQLEALSANGLTPERTDDDMLITYSFASGANVVELGLSRWTTTGACEGSNSAPCWGPIMTLGSFAEAEVNRVEVTDPISGEVMPELTFGEASIDLTAAGVFDRDTCVSFGSAYVKSRSSDSFSASMKDMIRPMETRVSNCSTITVRKNAVPDDAQDFGFTTTGGLTPASFDLDDDGDETNGLASSHTFVDKYDGTFTIEELPAEGWDLADVQCAGQATPQDDGDGPTGLVTIDVTPGDVVECTYTNVKRGRILVDQVSLPGGDPQSFSFDLSGGPDAIAQSFALADTTAPHDSGTLQPGTYAVAQLAAGLDWDLTSAVCDDGSPVGAVVLDAGETVTCTFTNTKRGRIVVHQQTDPDGDPQLFDFTLSGGPDATDQSFMIGDLTAGHDSGLLRPGAYAVDQLAAGAAWDATGATCDDGSAPGAVALDPGEVVTCTFTNAKRGRIVVDQSTTPAGDPQLFDFNLSGGPDATDQDFQLADASAPHDSGYLRAGAYGVSQGDDGAWWDLSGATCDDGSPVGAIDLAAGETVTCSFANVKRGSIVIDLTTNPAGDPQLFDFTLSGGPDGFDDAFQLADASAAYDSGPVREGGYVAAQGDAGAWWDLSGATCDDGSPVSAIDLSPGETVTCTFADIKRGSIVIDLATDPSGDPQLFDFTLSGGPDGFDDAFQLADATAAYDSGPVREGSYAAAQSDAGIWWDLSGTTCDDGSPAGAIALSPGETVTCTFTNAKRGQILVDVTTDPAGDPQLFDFTLSGGPDGLNDPFQLADASAPHDSGAVRAGTYDLADGDAGIQWDGTSASCSDGSPLSAIDLSPGETVSCSFDYVKRGKIVIDVTTDPSGDPQLFDFTLSGGPDSLNDNFQLADASAPHDSGFVRSGSYQASQADGGDWWDASGGSCDDGSPVSAIELAPGETVTCTFGNVKRGQIVIVKQAYPQDPQDFDFTIAGPELNDGFILDDDGDDSVSDSTSYLDLPGAYTIVQADAGEAWDTTEIGCSDSTDASIGSTDTATGTASFDLQPGETVTCLFVDVKRGRILVTKTVEDPTPGLVYDPAQQAFVFNPSWGDDFVLRHGETHDSGYLLPNEKYSVSEQGLKGWVASSNCSDGSSAGSIDLEPGAEVTCEFLNEMRIHPGSQGFWRNWRNHYTEAEFRAIVADALSGYPVFATLFDPQTGELLPDAIAHIDAIYDFSDGALEDGQGLMSEVTTTLLNLGVSKSGDPAIQALQRNDDICLTCRMDFGDDPDGEALVRNWAPCDMAEALRIVDVVAASTATFNGNVSIDDWSHDAITEIEQDLLRQVFGDINHGVNLVVDPDSYPDDPTCITLDGPTTDSWYVDGDGDGHGTLAGWTQTCDGALPGGYADNYDDCDDGESASYPGAAETCDGIANDCNADSWPLTDSGEVDADGDGVFVCGGDCDDANAAIYPGAAQLCDGINNDCNDPGWPVVSQTEFDHDGDGFSACSGDCADDDAARHPNATEACDGVDNDCSGYADDDGGVVDGDGDGVASACDICPDAFDADQADTDGDGFGDACDNCVDIFNAGQADRDADLLGDMCDICPLHANPGQEDDDFDGVGDACDVCPGVTNPSQADRDGNFMGDHCDRWDGMIYIQFETADGMVQWDDEWGFASWKFYRGDLGVLRSQGLYTQDPLVHPLARQLGVTDSEAFDPDDLPPGAAVHFLVTGMFGAVESELGTDSAGNDRPNDNPCP